ncbi:GNAT family N-acetyltransferase [Streptomyces sp. NBC_01476]|uniref:GNAT family N-acetyltransferase n=1 Tax=Streptomyces sp. NBC_01476 TaxID=2903881 RepID=UPI002E33336C|nr:GNAT family N-acetyltransferase [Streptomyces sp. NBC_01476]
MNHPVRIRRIAEEDWDAIVALEAGAYTALGLCEGRPALEAKVRASPATCFALDHGRRLAGYLLALPYPGSESPALTSREEVVFHSRNLHLHDLVIARDLRGRGLGKALVRHLTAGARQLGYEQISLVAVGGSHTFWAAIGFTARREVVNSPGYGPGSVYMSMSLPPEQAERPTAEHPAPAGALPSGAPSREYEVG